jgi:hypothetical protein
MIVNVGQCRVGLKLGFALLAAGCAAAGLSTSAIAQTVAGAPLAGSQPVIVHSVLVFPTANDAGDAADSLNVAPKLDQAIRFRLNTIGHLNITYFSRHLAAIERSVDLDKTLSESEVTPPFDDTSKAGPVAQQVSTDAYLVDRVDSYTWDGSGKKATIEVSANIYDTQSGNGIAGISLTGTGVSISGSDDQTSITQYAIDDAASQIVREIDQSVAPAPTYIDRGSQIGGSNRGTSILLAIVGGALLFAAFNHTGHSSGSGGNSGGGGGGGGGGAGNPPGSPFARSH